MCSIEMDVISISLQLETSIEDVDGRTIATLKTKRIPPNTGDIPGKSHITHESPIDVEKGCTQDAGLEFVLRVRRKRFDLIR